MANSLYAISKDFTLYEIEESGQAHEIFDIEIEVPETWFELNGFFYDRTANTLYLGLEGSAFQEGIYEYSGQTSRLKYLTKGERPYLYNDELYFFYSSRVFKHSSDGLIEIANIGQPSKEVVFGNGHLFAELYYHRRILDLNKQELRSFYNLSDNCYPRHIQDSYNYATRCDPYSITIARNGVEKTYKTFTGWILWSTWFIPAGMFNHSDWMIGRCTEQKGFKNFPYGEDTSCIYNPVTKDKVYLDIELFSLLSVQQPS